MFNQVNYFHFVEVEITTVFIINAIRRVKKKKKKERKSLAGCIVF